MELNDPYFHPLKKVRRFERLQTWTAALICIVGIATFCGGASAHAWVLMMDAGVEPGFWMTAGKVAGGILGFWTMTVVWVVLQATTRFGRWLQFYSALALREYTRL